MIPRVPASDAAVLVIETESSRRAFLDRAETMMTKGECLVRVLDVVGLRRAVWTTPRDSRARLVARELPSVMRGGLTSLVTYWRVPADALGAEEEHWLDGQRTHVYEVALHVSRTGKRQAAPGVTA